MSNTELIGSSAKFRAVLHQVNTVASTNNSVLIPGETGTGKEMIAQAIYQAGTRRHYKFVSLNCAAIPAALQESDLFGHERGAFSGVVTQSLGRFQAVERIAKVAPPESTVLNSAEIGRGMELTARASPQKVLEVRVGTPRRFELAGGGMTFRDDVGDIRIGLRMRQEKGDTCAV
jgi:transcriptional regulator with GAF, ATPase, and Fis domain